MLKPQPSCARSGSHTVQSPAVSPAPLLQNLPLLRAQPLAARALHLCRPPRLGTAVGGSRPFWPRSQPQGKLVQAPCPLHLVPTDVGKHPPAPGLAQDLLSALRARTTMVQQHAVPVGAEQGSPTACLSDGGGGENASQQGFKAPSKCRKAGARRHRGQGILGSCATSTARHQACWGRGKIRGRRKATGSCAFLWCQGRLVFELLKRKPGSGSGSAFAPSRARSVPSVPAAGPAAGDALCSLLASTSGAPGREMRGADPMWNWQKPGVKTQPVGLKSREISPGRFFSLKSPLAPSREVQRTRPSLRRGQGAQPKLFIHHFAPRREERSNGTPGEIRHGCCSCARREPRPPLRAHRCI